MYIKEKDFGKFADGKNVVNFGNPYYKEVDGEVVHIIPKGEVIVVKTLSEEDKKWFCAVRTNEDVVEMEMTVGGWFPTELVCGTIDKTKDGRRCMEHFSMNTALAQKTGWLDSTGTLGSRSDLFLASKADAAIKILKKSGFKVKFLL